MKWEGEFSVDELDYYETSPPLKFFEGDSICITISNLQSTHTVQMYVRKGGSGGDLYCFWFNLTDGYYRHYISATDQYVVCIFWQEEATPPAVCTGYCKVVRKFSE
ncbi:MAG: hypothetical protein ACTSQ8_18710 [Candidatus Helarchaeota archaeon]